MKALQNPNNTATGPYRTRVQLVRKAHPKFGQFGVIVAALPNPSKRPENQWYDVRFEDGTYERFPGRDLHEVTIQADD
jgi:hypothetical protein